MNQGGPGLVYFARCAATGLVKVGHTRNLRLRMIGLKSELQSDVQLIATVEVPLALRTERAAQSILKPYCVHGEWFQIDDAQVLRTVDIMDGPIGPTYADEEAREQLA